MPSTTPDLSTVTCGASSLRAAGGWPSAPVAPAASVNVVGVRGLRRGGGRGASVALARSGFGQASSNVAGGGSGGTGGGGASAAGPTLRTEGSIVRAEARSRSLREEEENNRLRRGLTAGSASACSGAATASARPRDATSSYQGGEGAAGPALSAAGGSGLNIKPSSAA